MVRAESNFLGMTWQEVAMKMGKADGQWQFMAIEVYFIRNEEDTQAYIYFKSNGEPLIN